MTPDSQTVTATCSTTGVVPSDYLFFLASCAVTPSDGTPLITSAQCPDPLQITYPKLTDIPYGSSAKSNPAGVCSIVFQAQPGVTYTINSGHGIWFNTLSDCYVSFGIQMSCYVDPEGFLALEMAGGDPRVNTQTSSITQEVTSTYPAQEYKMNYQPLWGVASSSAIYTPVSAIIADTNDIMNGNVTVKLNAPSGTTGDLNLDFNGADASGQELSQAPFATPTLGSQNLQLPFDIILPGIYPIANGTWVATLPGVSTTQTVNVPDYKLPTPWTYFRKIFYTQYNIPHESACAGSDADAWIVSTSVANGQTKCDFKKVKLNSQFIAATWMNGTGVSLNHGTLKNAAAVNLGDTQNCAGQYPPGAIGHTKASGNTFEIVSTVTGSCNTALIADHSLARPCIQIGRQCPVAVLSGVQSLSCGDQLNLDNGDYTTASTRSVDDLCPACSDPFTFHGADGHIDAFSSSESCTGGAVGTLGFFYTSYPTN